MRRLLRDEVRHIAGQFEIGGGVTIFRHDAHSPLVNLHEQTHRDNLNNTLFGYWLVRLAHLDGKRPWTDYPPASAMMTRAMNDAWSTLEGAAVFTEFVSVHLRVVKVDKTAWRHGLPGDYLRAFGKYHAALGGFLKPGADPDFQNFAVTGLAHAVAECTLDDALSTLRETPRGFDDLTRCFARARIEAALARYLAASQRISHVDSLRNAGNPTWLQEGPEPFRIVRGYVMAMKQAMVDLVRPRSAVGMLPDTRKRQTEVEIDALLCVAFPDLPTREVATHYQGGAATADFSALEPTWQLPRRTVAAEAAATHILKASEQPDTFTTALSILRDPESGVASCSIIPVSLVSEGGVIGGLTLISETVQFEAPAEDIVGLDERFSATGGFFWITPLILLGAPTEGAAGPYDWEFLAALKSPVYIFSESFAEMALSALLAFLGQDATLTAVSMSKGGSPIDMVCVTHRHLRIFWTMSGMITDRARELGWADVGGRRFAVAGQQGDPNLLAAGCLVLSGIGKPE